MSKKIVNLTLLMVLEEVEKVLDSYPQYPYQHLFTILALHQDLVDYVISQIPNTFALIEETHSPSNQTILPRYCEDERQKMENLIHQGIRHVMQLYNWTS